jgi:hypothetical protein
MSRRYEDGPSDAVVAAMEIIRGLSGDNRAFPPDQLIRLCGRRQTPPSWSGSTVSSICTTRSLNRSR